jgi:guanylate kinase
MAKLQTTKYIRDNSVSQMSGILLIISGPSGVGKTTICRRLTERLGAFLSVSATTRRQRDNEIHGKDYFFLSVDEFETRLRDGRCLEHAKVYGGNYYGTPAEPVQEALDASRVVILEIEIEGTIQVKRRFPKAVGVYILAPTPDEQAQRLVGRQKDTPEAIAERLSKADGEIRYAQDCGAYDYFLINHDVEETVETIVKIVQEKQKHD